MTGYSNYISGVDIYQKLKEDILTLRLKPGQMISENEVANIYNVSRTPIKNAFLRLKGENYIEIVPQKGTFVTLLDMGYIKDAIYMRAVLEMDTFDDIIEKGLSEKVAAKMETILEQQLALVESAAINAISFYEVDNSFHLSLFEAVGRSQMWDIIQYCQVFYTRFRMLDAVATARCTELYREHCQILQAFKAGDRDQLKAAVFGHLHSALPILADRIESEFKEYFVH